MNKSTKVNLIGLSIAGLSLGVFLGFSNLFVLIFLFGLTVFLGLIFIIAKLVEFFLKTKNPFVSYASGFVLMGLSIALLTSIVTMNRIAASQKKLTERLIPILEAYKEKHAQYPAQLSDLSIKGTDKLTYWTDSMQQSYTIHYWVDGWHMNEYDSKEKEWIKRD